MTDILYPFFGIAIVILLVLQTLVLLFRSGLYTPTTPKTIHHAVVESAAAELFPGIPLSEHATVAEQAVFLERLSALPQIRRLPDGSLVDWMTGAQLLPCNCRHYRTHPHLQLVWANKNSLGMLTRGGLTHYLAYQERIARLLAGPCAVEGVAP